MPPVEIVCSRCRHKVEGYELDGATAGFVRVDRGRYRGFARPGETLLCEACLVADPKFQRDPGADRGVPGAHGQIRMGL